MRRLPGILLLTGAALVVIAALLVSGLRIALPHLDAWRPEILNKIESATGMPVKPVSSQPAGRILARRLKHTTSVQN